MERLPSADFTYRPFASPDPPVPSVMKRFLENFHAGIHSSTDLYICCICGDGPKVFQNQGRCVNCDHDVCGYCARIK
ncbi:hypothetical protein PABG_03891 [Paracoccidioides brasiliensis Pb03]|uniref:Uncharacterized protein n=2 Tax=Paracoccidioides brasiliensis TaxID=121759 RepID=A0A0A0HUA6_PARBD|nr:uncharacterized protein PADG_12282 [Paracoccidioides brasiliensis Pb18]EEH21675.2 hypothetical protein PABG_03891 [Paracoccidioides brasiliensis Pb03]KGM91601.1 hypothetical protein PADG_12282 [Paracoccidioides brasiliensis Pb18]ODH39094.1 hypothetical protein ACO22_02026 [Paracoccidioides brasiliensis]ODH52030.1 hypothetical protein GX48_01818 [Paracoccidioides brasiliensis]